MSKIFRLYKGGSETYEDWNVSSSFPYDATARESIDDPDGASARYEITSIPSPFARIALVKTAFKELIDGVYMNRFDLDGDTIYHKMVSDALDVGEIFFNIDKYKDKIEIITWNPEKNIEDLEESVYKGHRYLGDVLRKYMSTDASTCNFDKLGNTNIYLLNFLQGPEELNIIGATSPASVFFCSANKLPYVSRSLGFGRDCPFDEHYQPLYKRNPDYVAYWYSLSHEAGFSENFPEVARYLELNFQQFPGGYPVLASMQKQKKYLPIEANSGRDRNNVEVLGIRIGKNESVSVSETSEFVLRSTCQEGNLPLVLPVEAGNKYADLKYVSDKWGRMSMAPCKPECEDWTRRVLPGDGAEAAWLSVSDFLEDYIIRIPERSFNAKDFFSGMLHAEEDERAYLLPLKNLFFQFFTVEDLMGKGPLIDIPMFEMEALSGDAVRAILRIPVKGNARVKYIEYERMYYASRAAEPEKNCGGVKEFEFNVFLLPNHRFRNPEEAIYTIACVTKKRGYTLSFYEEKGVELSDVARSCRTEQVPEDYNLVSYAIEQHDFDFLKISDGEVSGLVVPLFAHREEGSEAFHVAVDLGTSNTHVEISMDGKSSSSLADEPVCSLFKLERQQGGLFQQEGQLMEHDLIPWHFGGDGDFGFPNRTVLFHGRSIDWNAKVLPLGMANLGFTYGKRVFQEKHDRVCLDLKWGKEGQKARLEAYIECLMYMIRNKVVMAGGRLASTELIWFYPTSMTPNRREQLRLVWDKAYKKYIHQGKETRSMTESAAPMLYFRAVDNTVSSLINIDVGGGTTDVAFSSDNQLQFVTSFRFAANDLFDDPFQAANQKNGMVEKYKDLFKDVLKTNAGSPLWTIFSQMEKPSLGAKPSDMAWFMFSMKNNSLLRTFKVHGHTINPATLDFESLLRMDDDFKIVWIVFYTALIYHVAYVVKVKGLDFPRHLSFTGNGSKMLRILTTDLDSLTVYTKKIFEKVLDRSYPHDLTLRGLEETSCPKESSCKGGLFALGEGREDVLRRQEVEPVVLQPVPDGLAVQSLCYDSLKAEDARKSLLASIDVFFDFLDHLSREFDFMSYFGVPLKSLDLLRSLCERSRTKDFDTWLKRGIEVEKQESPDASEVYETLFFWPIKGIISRLVLELFEQSKSKA